MHDVKKRLCIALGGVAYIAPLRIGNDKMRIADVGNCLFKTLPSLAAIGFVKGRIRFIGDAIISRCIDYLFVECIDGIICIEQVFGNFLNIGI